MDAAINTTLAPDLPSTEDIKSELLDLGHGQLQGLARLSEVPFTTLWNIRSGVTSNPGLETVRKFWPLIPEARRQGAKQPAQA